MTKWTEQSEIKIGKTFDRETCIQFKENFCQINKFMIKYQWRIKDMSAYW